MLKSFVFGWPPCLPIGHPMDNTVYIRFVAVVVFHLGAFTERRPLFLAVLLGTLALLWFSLGGFFTVAAYYINFPFSKYRHVGLVCACMKILVVICAGFGWENFWSSVRRGRRLLLVLVGFAFLVDALRFLPNFWVALSGNSEWPLFFVLRCGMYLALAGMAVWAARGAPKPAGVVMMQVALLGGLALDLLSYQGVIWIHTPELPPGRLDFLDSVKVHPIEFQEQRSWEPITVRQKQAMLLATRKGGRSYSIAYGFARFDPCLPAYHNMCGQAFIAIAVRNAAQLLETTEQ